MTPRFKTLRHRLEWLALLALAKGLPLLPRPLCLAVARAVGDLLYCCDFRGRKVVEANLAIAFEQVYNQQERRDICKKSYRSMACIFFDLFWSQRMNRKNYRQYVRFEDHAGLEELQKNGRGIIFAGIHYGNFELGSIFFGLHDVQAMVLSQDFKNPLIEKVINHIRRASGQSVIKQAHSLLRLYKRVKQGGVIGVLVDLNLKPTLPCVLINSFGMETSVTYIHAEIARRAGAPIIPMLCIPDKDWKTYTVLSAPPIWVSQEMQMHEAVQRCWDYFETKIRQRPELWLWVYKHWRYRPKDASPQDYPFYANVSSVFEKLRKRQQTESAAQRG